MNHLKVLWSKGLVFILPLFVLQICVFDLPILGMLGRSVTFPDVTAEHFVEIFSTDLYAKVLWNTFLIAGSVALIVAAIGYPLAYWIKCLGTTGRIVALSLVVIPFWVSVLIRTYAWIVMLGNVGVVNSVLIKVGAISTPIAFLFNKVGVVIGIVNVLLPFLILPLVATMVKFDDRLLDAARTLGANDQQVFWRVYFPLTVPSLVAGAMMVFVMALGFYVTPMILGGGRVPMLVNMLDLLVNRMPNWPLAAALSVLLLAATLMLYAGSRRIKNHEHT